MKEHEFGHGVLRRNPLIKRVQKLSRRLKGQTIGKAIAPFNWAKGYDVRDTIGTIQIKNQGSSSSCGGQAGAYFLEIQERLRNIKEGAISAKSIYSPWRNLGGGMTVTQVNTQIGAHGANLEATVPSYDIYGNPLSEMMMSDRSWETAQLDTDALTRAGYLPYDIAEDIETVAQTIQNYGAVIMEIRGNNNSTWMSSMPSTYKGNNPFWYHYMILIGAKLINGEKHLIALNSWGDQCGNNGEQCFGEEWFTSKNIIDAFTYIHNSQVVVVPTPNLTVMQKMWQSVILWFQSQKAKAKRQIALARYLAS